MYGGARIGGYAEFIVVNPSQLSHIPKGMTFDEASMYVVGERSRLARVTPFVAEPQYLLRCSIGFSLIPLILKRNIK